VAVVFDEGGHPRFHLAGIPRLGHGLSTPLSGLLSPVAAAHLDASTSWSITDLLDRLDTLMNLPGEAARAAEADVKQGAAAPDFALASLSGPPTSLHAQIGHPVVVNFWATWCTPCRRELPLLAHTARAHPDLRILAVDEGEGRGDVASFLREVLGVDVPLSVLLDGDRSVAERYHVVGLTVSVFVDGAGTVRSVHVGELNDPVLNGALRTILVTRGARP